MIKIDYIPCLSNKTGHQKNRHLCSVQKTIPIQIRKERTTEAYKETTNQDIKTIDKYLDRRVINKTQWRPINEVIDEDYTKNLVYFLMILSESVKKNQTNHNSY